MLTLQEVIDMALAAGAADYGQYAAIRHEALLELVNAVYTAGRAAEREACAQLVERTSDSNEGDVLAAAIRARGEEGGAE